MLQQTTVAAVVPYFERFLTHFPQLANLAAAEERDVLRLWEGLGYYRRARDLHRAARIVATEYSGVLPTDATQLRQLPGFGRYTANAVLSQAYDQRLPILEANSTRVLCRLLGVRDDPKSGATQQLLWRAAEELLPRRNIGQFNQSLMELGALVCTPTNPTCSHCPLRARCEARRLGAQAEIPRAVARPKALVVDEVAVVLWDEGRVLLAQRPPRGRWANMWEFPHMERNFMEGDLAAGERLLSALGLRGRLRRELTTVRHSVTRFRITLVCLEAERSGGRFNSGLYANAVWLAPAALADYPLSVPQRKLAAVVCKAQAP